MVGAGAGAGAAAVLVERFAPPRALLAFLAAFAGFALADRLAFPLAVFAVLFFPAAFFLAAIPWLLHTERLPTTSPRQASGSALAELSHQNVRRCRTVF